MKECIPLVPDPPDVPLPLEVEGAGLIKLIKAREL